MLKPLAIALLASAAALPTGAGAISYVAGNLVVSVEGAGLTGGTYTDNQAAPLSLFEFTQAGTYVDSQVLSQTASGANYAVSAEYGSSSEGTLHLSGDGRSLTIMGYGVNAADFNANPAAYGTAINSPTKPTALGQSGSLTNAGYTPVARVVASIDASGNVDSSTALFNVYNGNNPRAVYTADGRTFYTSGQGTGADATGGVFVTTLGSHGATAITGLDTSAKTISQDTRDVQIVGSTLTTSVDSKGGSNNARSFVGTLGTPPATGLYDSGNGPTQLSGFGTSASGKYGITAATTNGINTAGSQINLSPENFFYANATTLYVADAGATKQNSASSLLGDGGLQKWSLVNGTWVLDYTLAAGLNLVPNSSAHGTSGLYGLTGMVLGDQVLLYATNYTLSDLDQTYLYGITDLLSATTKQTGESFTQLAAAPADSNFMGVSFAPTAGPTAAVPEPATWATLMAGFGLVGGAARRRRPAGQAKAAR